MLSKQKANHVVFPNCVISLLIAIFSKVMFAGRDHLVRLVVKVSASRAEDPGLDFHLCPGDFSGLSHTSDSKIGTPVATLIGA